MTTPWERELAEKKKRDENTYTAVRISTVTAETLRKRPRIVFWATLLTVIVVGMMVVTLYAEYRYSIGLSTSGYSRRHGGGFAHPSQAILIILLPVATFFSAVGVRHFLMRDAASEISRKIARKVKCGPELEKAIFNMVIRTPWSNWRIRSLDQPGSNMQQVVTQFGESRTLEFTDDFSSLIVGPQRWVDKGSKTLADEFLERVSE